MAISKDIILRCYSPDLQKMSKITLKNVKDQMAIHPRTIFTFFVYKWVQKKFKVRKIIFKFRFIYELYRMNFFRVTSAVRNTIVLQESEGK